MPSAAATSATNETAAARTNGRRRRTIDGPLVTVGGRWCDDTATRHVTRRVLTGGLSTGGRRDPDERGRAPAHGRPPARRPGPLEPAADDARARLLPGRACRAPRRTSDRAGPPGQVDRAGAGPAARRGPAHVEIARRSPRLAVAALRGRALCRRHEREPRRAGPGPRPPRARGSTASCRRPLAAPPDRDRAGENLVRRDGCRGGVPGRRARRLRRRGGGLLPGRPARRRAAPPMGEPASADRRATGPWDHRIRPPRRTRRRPFRRRGSWRCHRATPTGRVRRSAGRAPCAGRRPLRRQRGRPGQRGRERDGQSHDRHAPSQCR